MDNIRIRIPLTVSQRQQTIPLGVQAGGGTRNYNALTNKPAINGHELVGDQTAAELGLVTPEDIPIVPTKTSDLTNDSGFVNAAGAEAAAPVQNVNGQTGAVTLDAEAVGALPESSTLDDIPDGSTYKRATAAQLQQISTNAADIRTQGGEIDQLQTDVDAIEQKIPNQASAQNQLADKAFVNSSINSAAAYFRGAFPTRAALFAVPWQTADPQAENYVSNNDYAYVADDETHSDEAWRYIYVLQPGGTDNGWQPQFRVNESPLTAAQLAALNSGATAALIDQISTNAAAIALKQAIINASGILKGNGNGQVSAAVAGTDYQTPLTAGTDYATPAQVNAKYTKPVGGIPASDMAQTVQTSLGLADTALQAVPNTYRTAADQDVIDAGKLPITTKYAGSQSVGGAADKTVSIPMGSVDLTSTATDFKATVDGITELRSGVLVWLTNGVVTSAAGCTLNINNLGAKPIYNSIAATTATTTSFNVNYTMLFIYNATRVEGGCWDMVYGYDSNTTYTPVKLGFGYATCTTAAATTAKVASLSSYSLVAGGLVAVHFANDVPASATLNINSKGAKAIYYKGAAIKAGVINAGDTALFVYSTYYRLLSIDRWGDDISSILTTVAAKYTKPVGGIPASDLASAVQTSLGKADTALQSVPNTYRTAAAQDVIDQAQDEEIADLKSAFGLTDIGVKSASITQPNLTFVQGNRISALNGSSGSSFYCSIESTPVKVSAGAYPLLFTAKAGKKYTLTVRHISGSHNGSNPLDVQVLITDGTNYIAQIPASGGTAVYSPAVDTPISVCIYVKYSVVTTNLIFEEMLIEGDFRVTTDVQVAGTSVVTNGVANIPMASASTPGVVISGTVTVTGTTPTINAQPGVRYVCGEVATLDITLPTSGVVDVVFESGSVPTVLTITPPSGVTLKWANGFDPDNLAANTSYEIRVTDGSFGVADASGADSGAKSLGVTGAQVGDFVKVKAVDANGVPTAWEPYEWHHTAFSVTSEEEQTKVFTIENSTAVSEILVVGIVLFDSYDGFCVWIGNACVTFNNIGVSATNKYIGVNIKRTYDIWNGFQSAAQWSSIPSRFSNVARPDERSNGVGNITFGSRWLDKTFLVGTNIDVYWR